MKSPPEKWNRGLGACRFGQVTFLESTIGVPFFENVSSDGGPSDVVLPWPTDDVSSVTRTSPTSRRCFVHRARDSPGTCEAAPRGAERSIVDHPAQCHSYDVSFVLVP